MNFIAKAIKIIRTAGKRNGYGLSRDDEEKYREALQELSPTDWRKPLNEYRGWTESCYNNGVLERRTVPIVRNSKFIGEQIFYRWNQTILDYPHAN